MDSRGERTAAHVPVLLEPVLASLNVKADGIYMDGTFGRGGHSRAILARLGPRGRLIAIDRDPQALDEAPTAVIDDPRAELVRGEFADIGSIAAARQLSGRIDGILLDLGVSSPQLDRAERGFSFRADGPLDMRMNPDSGASAADWLASVPEVELRGVLRRYGEEPAARRLAAAIVAARRDAPVDTTGRLVDVIESVLPRQGRRHPATRAFQAIRMQVNDEIGQLDRALSASVPLLRRGGRLCVISFHSLEDRLVKRFRREATREPAEYRGLPDVPEDKRPPFRLVGKLVRATEDEIRANPRSRSARLRVAERLP